MLISVGILAWNEEENIARTLQSLFGQSVFTDCERFGRQYCWEVLVIPNGCCDGTASVAREVLSKCVASLSSIDVHFDVLEINQAGKSNAWNRYVHDFSDKTADLIILMDADVEFGQRETIENVIAKMIATPSADVVVDLPMKDIVRKERKTFQEWLSVRSSTITLEAPPGICGQFYCARGGLLRSIWMPIGLSGEDSFLRAMVITNLFRSPVNENRVVRATNASHYYEDVPTLAGIFRHKVRLFIGTALNCYLTWDGLYFLTDPDGPGAGVVIHNLTQRDPNWYENFINNSVKNRGWWVLPPGMLWGRLEVLKELSGMRKLKTAIILLAGALFDIPVMLQANKKIKAGKSIGYW